MNTEFQPSPSANETEQPSSAEQISNNAAAQHPRRRRWIIWTAAACLLLGAGVLLSQRASGPMPGAQSSNAKNGGKSGGKGKGGGAIPVASAKVTKGNMGIYINALGTVTPVYTVSLTSRVVGTLEDLHYREGQMVHKGDLLAVIDPRPYQALVLQAQGQLERDQAQLANAHIDLHRYQAAFSQHAIPEQTLATQVATVNSDQGNVKLDEGTLESAKVNLNYTQIRAPISGRVGLRQTDPGNIVQANGTTPLLTITQLEPITVIFTMAEDYISDVTGQMRKGHKMRVDALSRDNQTELAQGTLLTVDNQVDVTTGTVKVRAIFQNHDYKLFPNEFVNAKLLVRTLMGVNIVPNAAIQRNNDVSFVYIVDQNTTVKSRNIQVATSDGNNSAVTGVTPGETVVTDGFDKLQDGMKVALRKELPASSGPSNVMNQSQENTQAPSQGAAGTQINTAQQNPQSSAKK